MAAKDTRRPANLLLITTLIGAVLGSLVIISLLASVDWDASALLRVGEDNPAVMSYVEMRLDHVRPVAPSGHDGKFYFIQAHDPLLLHPEEHANLIVRPVYRTQRMLYPLLASGGGFLSGWGVVWGLIIVNLLAIALGTWATSQLAMSLGASPWLGLTFALNPGVFFELIIDGAGALGWALAVLAVWLLVDGKYVPAVAALASAVLAREAMMVVALGAAVWLWRSNRLRAIGIVTWPAVGALLWAVWVRVQLGVPLLTSESEEIGVPFAGLAGAVRRWFEPSWLNLAFGALVIGLLVVAAMQVVRRPSLVSYSTFGFVVLAPLLSRQVWLNYFDISRAVAPIFTSFVLVVFADESQSRTAGGAS